MSIYNNKILQDDGFGGGCLKRRPSRKFLISVPCINQARPGVHFPHRHTNPTLSRQSITFTGRSSQVTYDLGIYQGKVKNEIGRLIMLLLIPIERACMFQAANFPWDSWSKIGMKGFAGCYNAGRPAWVNGTLFTLPAHIDRKIKRHPG